MHSGDIFFDASLTILDCNVYDIHDIYWQYKYKLCFIFNVIVLSLSINSIKLFPLDGARSTKLKSGNCNVGWNIE